MKPEVITQAIAKLPAEQQREWRGIHRTPDASPLSLEWRTMPMWTPEQREAVAIALHDWALEQTDASDLVLEMTASSRRVGVWLTCAVVRTVLSHVPDQERGPRVAVETAERWVRGLATVKEARSAASGAYEYGVYGKSSLNEPRSDGKPAAFAAARVADAAGYANSASDAVFESVDNASDQVAYHACACGAPANSFYVLKNSALRDFCQTISVAMREALSAAAEGYARY